ncbi:hypothetical protein CYMTET_14050 [Cymbomonas tetramitiformis]|uniref:DNA/RNA-binding protein Alba-like domain-containing protein n=1 Tax=Cymbomonas tetramitiformis TaxID=36881 RepID=A0AAE0LAE4_9CHLO|nr:hypothetical protein CYMTET_14050 [Cymbomonas tetramitiformis]
MDRYIRVEKAKPDVPIDENEVRIMTTGKMRNYISYATNLLEEKCLTYVTLKAMGRAINKTVTIAEIIKRRVVGLHQNTSICSTDITDVWEPLEEGLNRLETKRSVSMITITLSKAPLDTSLPGYQPPLPEDQVIPLQDFEREEMMSGGKGRGRGTRGGRGGRGRGMLVDGDDAAVSSMPDSLEDSAYDVPLEGEGRGKGRGKGVGKGGAGKGKGGRGGRGGKGKGKGGRGKGEGMGVGMPDFHPGELPHTLSYSTV